MQELIDVYDRERTPTGLTIPREGAFLTEGQYMLYVLFIIEASDGRMLITQRSMDKGWGAGWWEIGGGGV
ncbi:MAG: DNA mismatch repair protein MutT, partial [Atopobiaceae bacterium]|nr:DNA mismatch repair protein MutT [Atopobiaceae bacterium]